MMQLDEGSRIQPVAFAIRHWTIESLRRFFRVIAMSPANYWLAYITDFACAAVFGVLGLRANGTGFLAVACFLGGAFAFSFVEYALHRWLFHSNVPICSELHASHHSQPKQPAALPFWFSAGSAPAFFWMLAPWFGAFVAHFVLCGFFAGYFGYGVVHHLQHSIRIKNVPFRWVRSKWAAHAVHHGRIDVNFGVTTSLWDRLLDTYYPVARR